METIAPDGRITYRTKLTPDLDAAKRTARMFDANPRFCDVLVVCSATAKTPKWFVEFRPVNTERQQDMHQRQQDSRQARADVEGAQYIYWPVPDAPGAAYCFNPKSGATYTVTATECNCPDFVERCFEARLHCKHQLALQAPAATIARKSWFAASVNLDF